MTTLILINVALSIPVFAAILGLVLWSFSSQRGDRPHVFVRRRRVAARVATGRPTPTRSQLGSRREAWPAH